jgi:hypothetical protein
MGKSSMESEWGRKCGTRSWSVCMLSVGAERGGGRTQREGERGEWNRVACASNYDLYSIMQFADRINDRLFYRSYERQQQPYLAETELRGTGVPLHLLMQATTERRKDGPAGDLTLSQVVDRNNTQPNVRSH